MAMKTSDLIDEAVSLPLEERARVVDTLLQSLNPPDEAAAAAWLEVARRRLTELRSGSVAPLEGEQVFARIRSRYGA